MPITDTELYGIIPGGKQFTNIAEENLVELFTWGLVVAGMYDDINIENPGEASTVAPENLQPVKAQGFADGRVWQAPFVNWVYETGIPGDRQPISPLSNVYVNGSSALSSYYIDFTNGRVVFDAAIPTSSVVQVTYSYKTINVYNQNVPWFDTLIYDPFGPDQPTTASLPSGVLKLLENHAFQLPLIVTESIEGQRQRPYEIGNTSQWTAQNFLFHVVAENSLDVNNIVDIITRQKDRIFPAFNANDRAAANAYQLDWRGMARESSLMYPQLVSTYPFKSLKIVETSISKVSTMLPLFRSMVRVAVETVL